jgi:hypothetical protein
MNKLLLVVFCALAAAPHADAVIVQGTELAPYTAVTNQLATSHGVTFASANYNGVTFTELIPGTWGVYGCESWSPPSNGGWFNAPIFVTFVDPADGVTPATVNTLTANWGDGGGDFDAVDLRAYDLSNNLITTQTYTGSTFTQITLNATGIHRVEFWANTNVGSGTSDTGFDWISYPTPVVPSPWAGAALVAGLCTLRRRR